MILDASYTFDRSQLLFNFLADNRVDFRKLAKDLASIYKTRIELRQVGVRDKAGNASTYAARGVLYAAINPTTTVIINNIATKLFKFTDNY